LHPSRNICIHTNDLENFQKNQSISAELKYRWSNIDIITNDYLPYIGEIKDNLYLATGYNTWGMTNGSLAGEIISDLILNRNNQYSDLFNPKRSLKLTKLPSIIGSSIKGYKEGITKNFQTNKNITYNELDGRKIATYQDEKGIKHSVYLKCPHLKCNLIFNEVEKTWDCPCHGSRFNIDGKCLEGPSNYDISVDQTFDNVNHL
ncbi:MAG: FAD-dependent oxidoreductase, partial [Bacilli bacterium]|nr:FAD-dependent oxidoreductase [Bacilli bacterium]